MMHTEGNDRTERLLKSVHKFDFFQAVRLLERRHAQAHSAISGVEGKGGDGSSRDLVAVGHGGPPHSEAVTFRGIATLNFPPSPICFAEQQFDSVDGHPTSVSLSVAFLSLFGPLGALPRHYTEQVVERVRAHGDSTLQEFLNFLHHRTISLFYRAWQKYRFVPSVELGRALSGHGGLDKYSAILLALAGLSNLPLVEESGLNADFVSYYAGHLSRPGGRGEAMRKIIHDYFQVTVSIQEFVGRWVRIPRESQTSMTNVAHANCSLGQNTVSGTRVYDQTATVRICLGPLTLTEFRRFLPGSDSYQNLCAVIKLILGVEVDFEIQLILQGSDVPPLALGAAPSGASSEHVSDSTPAAAPVPGPRLGVDTWTSSHGFEEDVYDVILKPTIS
ncbi:MAG: type VI secretion system baseplate subunit TssG [Planctomycetaceae bacterium]|nr:type VI secretion system baseplate subunit TssG [Planctomycetaceae bacterium]